MDHTLLYIDSDPATRLLVQKALTSEGFVVIEARTAGEAQESAARIRPHLTVVNVDRVRAADLVPALRRSPGFEQVRLLASTAHTWPPHLEKMLALGFDRVVLQPFDIDTLAGELRIALPPTPPVEEMSHAQALPELPGAGPLPDNVVDDAGPVGEPRGDRTDPAAEPTRDDAIAPGGAEPPLDLKPAVLTLPSVGVPPLWRLALSPLIGSLLRSTASAEGLLAVLDEDDVALVVVATASSRHNHHGSTLDGGSPIGTRVVASTARWLDSALHHREAVVASTDTIEPSPLAPAGSHTLLILPVASRQTVYGVAILGKHRAFRAPIFSAGRIARGLSQAEQIAGVVDALRELERAMHRRRRQIEHLRLDTTRTLLTEVAAGGAQSRRTGAGKERHHHADNGGGGVDRNRAIWVGERLAERLLLPREQRDVLRQALEVWDIGTTWVEHVLFARATFPGGQRERLLDACAEHGAEILSALHWPAAVVEVVRRHHARWNGGATPAELSGADIPMPARILAVVGAFSTLTAGRTGEDATATVQAALAELSREASSRYDPEVVEALHQLCRSAEYGSLHDA